MCMCPYQYCCADLFMCLCSEARANAPKGPGDLDPFEVLDMLPAPMRDAFDSQVSVLGGGGEREKQIDLEERFCHFIHALSL